jgi:hypothetical protein
MTMRTPTFRSWLAAACLLAAPCAVMAQTSSAIPLQTGPQPTLTRHNTPPQPPLPWSQLSLAQQRMLAPVQAQWDKLGSQRQHRLADHATHWASLPSEHQQLIRQRLTRWAEMTPMQRRQLRQNVRAFHALPPAERAKISAAFRNFQKLSPAERHALRARWRAMPPQQRADWSNAHPIPLQPPASGKP